MWLVRRYFCQREEKTFAVYKSQFFASYDDIYYKTSHKPFRWWTENEFLFTPSNKRFTSNVSHLHRADEDLQISDFRSSDFSWIKKNKVKRLKRKCRKQHYYGLILINSKLAQTIPLAKETLLKELAKKDKL